MLRDSVRTTAYEDAISSNAKSLFEGKVVLDVGCGTGVLSLFCARAGARKVIGVDNSDVIEQAREICSLNGYDGIVTYVKGKMEELLLEGDRGLPLPVGETVDVIVSEWMGYALFFETMLPSVMAARDALMTPNGGMMYPNGSRIYLEGGRDAERLGYWNNVHGIDMSPMRERMARELTQEAWVELVNDECIITNRAMLIEHDLNKCIDEDLDFASPFELRPRDGGPTSLADVDVDVVEVHQLVISFDVDFAVPGTREVSFSTGCQSAPTHWKQVALWFDPLHNCPVLGRGEVMRGTFRMKRNRENHRSIDMCVTWETGKIVDGIWIRNRDGVIRRSLIA
jgi:SAM-dependent methyltransferase